MKERFLPIGTVVLLKGGKKEIMITSYCIFPNNVQIKNGQEIKPEKKIFEYGACIYPEGILDSNTICAFNHDQTPLQQELSSILNQGYEIYKDKYENSENNA